MNPAQPAVPPGATAPLHGSASGPMPGSAAPSRPYQGAASGAPQSARPAPSAPYREPSPVAEPVAPPPTAAEPDSGRRLIVGREISLSGAINACDHLVVEGEIEATLDDCQTIHIVEGGTFRGKAHVVRADIGGRVDGELVVSGKLTLRATGSIEGAVTYASLTVEEGGRIAGTLSPFVEQDGE